MTTEQIDKLHGTFSFWMSVWFFASGMGGIVALLYHWIGIA